MRSSPWICWLSIALAGCGTAARKPLFSVEPGSPRPTPRPQPRVEPARGATPANEPVHLAPAPQPLRADASGVPSTSVTREEIESLIARLRGGRSGERKAVLDRLVALGAAARADLERALEDATFETDVLHEALARVREADPSAPAHEPADRKGVASPWVEAKYRLALEKFLAGDDLGAQQLVDAILTVEPATTARPRLERLKHQIRDHLIAETVIAATLVLEDRVLTPAQPLRVKLRLENKTHESVVLKAGPGTPLGQVILDYEELQQDGTRALRRTTRPVKVAQGGIRLDPRARETLEVELPTEHASKRKGVVGRYRLSGVLRPYTLLAGEEPLPYFLPIPPIDVVVLDEDEKSLGDKPGEAFAKALKDVQAAVSAGSEANLERASHTGFTAALIWASQDRDAAVRAIVQALESADGSLERMLTAALARATGEPGSYSKEEWLAWWKSGASRPRSARPSGDEEDEAPPPIRVPR